MDPITSTENPQVKLARSLHEPAGRRKHAAFLVEGLRLVEAASESHRPQLVLHTPGFGAADSRERTLLRSLERAGAPVRVVTDRVLQHVSDTVTPQGIVAVVPLPERDAPADQKAGLDLILDEVSDPGNAGTLLRSAAAAGVSRVFSAPGSVDVYSPKVVRAGAGAHFTLTLRAGQTWDTIRSSLPASGTVYLTDVRRGRPYWDVDWTQAAALIVSNEARGASPAARTTATHCITIPMAGDVESLNAGVAGSVILFEALRQRMRNKE